MRFDGWVKSLRPTDLTDEQAVALKLTFGRFFEEPRTNEAVLTANDAFLGTETREQAFAFRRFAGGRDLPSGRYYTVCNDNFGDDGAALRGELLSYVDPLVSGPISVWDFCDPLLLGVRLAHAQRQGRPIDAEPIFGVTFTSERNVASPFFDELKRTHSSLVGPLTHADNDFTVYYPLRIERVSIEQTMDLRIPYVREWLADQVFSGIPTACYMHEKNIKHAANMFDIAKFARTELCSDHDDIKHAVSLQSNDVQKVQHILDGRVGFLAYGENSEGAKNSLRHKQKDFYSLLTTTVISSTRRQSNHRSNWMLVEGTRYKCLDFPVRTSIIEVRRRLGKFFESSKIQCHI